MNPTLDQIKSHKSIRAYTDQPVSNEIFNEIISAAQASATSSFIQACTVIRIRDADNRRKIASVAGGQQYVEKAPVFAVFCADLSRASTCCDLHNETMNSGFTEHFIIATVDVALMAQSAVIAAESLGLGICYIGAVRNDPQTVSEILRLPPLVYPVFGLCLGYPDSDAESKPRLPLTTVIKEEFYTADGDADEIESYDKVMGDYYATRSSNQKLSGWSEQMAKLMTKEARPHMKAFLESKGFCLK